MKKTSQFQLGLAAIEFVLILPLLIILAYIIIDFGRLLYQYDSLTKTTRDAAKYVARTVRPLNYTTDADYGNVITQAQNLALCGSIGACTDSVVPQLKASNIVIDYPASGVSGINYVRVTVQAYSTTFLTNVFGFSTKDLGAIRVTMRQVQQS
jgi:Flp pilus assembly protein TadG